MQISRCGSQPSSHPPTAYFTGTVRLDPLFQAELPARSKGNLVTFEPATRTNWHTHPLGQTIIITVGAGLVQCWGGAVQDVRQGDVVWFPPEEKHWHGAGPTTSMSHIAIGEALDGKTVDWFEAVSDDQYLGRAPAA
jgi:quercetin dioxygenase-like cupin family protein